MPVSIREVAKAANVSVSTVSRALNGYTDVSEETRRRIETVVRELGYAPNVSAKTLSSKSKNNVALIVSDLEISSLRDGFTDNLIRGAYQYMNERGQTVAMYGVTPKMQQEKALEDFCHEYSLAGVMLMGFKIGEPYWAQCEGSMLPCVGIDLDLKGCNSVYITTDDARAFEEITEYVLNKGHRRLVLVKGKDDAAVTYDREKGFFRAVQRRGIHLDEDSVLCGRFQETVAYEETCQYLTAHPEPGAVFVCMSDLMALGVFRAISQAGYRVPEDFSITGFDGMYFLRYLTPGITTIDQNISRKGYMGMKALLDMINGESVDRKIIVPHSLVERESVLQMQP